jgi:hypothetical protein
LGGAFRIIDELVGASGVGGGGRCFRDVNIGQCFVIVIERFSS